MKNSRYLNAGLFVVFFALFLHAIEDPDIWFHMTVGRAVSEHFSIPSKEFYIFTRLGEPSEFHEWGFGLIYHWIYSLASLDGMIILNALIGAITIYLLYASAFLRTRAFYPSIIAALIGLWLIEFRFVQRPETFLYLAIAMTLFSLEKYRLTNHWKWLAPIPVIGFLLSQIHPSVLILVLVVGAFLVESVIKNPRQLKNINSLVIVIISTSLISLANPYGIDQFVLPIKFSMQKELLNSLFEFLPALSTEYAYRFIIALILVAFCFIGIKRKYYFSEWLILLSFVYLAYLHARNIPLIGLALTLPLSSSLSVLFEKVNKQYFDKGILLFFALLIVIDISRFHRYSLDIDPWMAPIIGAETIKQNFKGGNIVNFIHLGNYLAWRLGDHYRVIADGRNFNANESIHLHDYLLSAQNGWEKILDDYNVVAIVTPSTLPYSGNFVPLAISLVNNSLLNNYWCLEAREPSGLTFLRRKQPCSGTLNEKDIWLQARDELNLTLKYYPDSTSALQSLKYTNQKIMEYSKH